MDLGGEAIWGYPCSAGGRICWGGRSPPLTIVMSRDNCHTSVPAIITIDIAPKKNKGMSVCLSAPRNVSEIALPKSAASETVLNTDTARNIPDNFLKPASGNGALDCCACVRFSPQRLQYLNP